MSKTAIKKKQKTELSHALNAAAASLQRLTHSGDDVFRAFREQVVALGLRGALSLLDESGKRLIVCAVAEPGQFQKALARLEKLVGIQAESYPIPVAEVDAYRRVMESGEAVFVPDTSAVVAQLIPAAARPMLGRILKVFGAAPGVFAPLVTEGKVQGLLNMIGASLTADDVPAIVAFANHIAVALENARLFSTLRDVEESLKLFRTLIDRSNDAIEVLDPETGRFLDVNEKGCLYLGYSREEFLALSVFDIDPMLDQSEFTRDMQELRNSGYLLLESAHRRKDGSTFPVEVNIKYVQLDRGYIVTVVRDITERKRLEQALRKSEETHRMVLNGIDEIVYQIRQSAENPFEGSIEFVSERAQEVLGYRPVEFMTDPKRWFSLIHPEDIPTLQSQTIKILTTRHPGIREYRILDINGKYRWMEDRVTPEIDEAGRVVRIFGVARDITERKHAQQALQESQKMYREVVENASDIIYSTDRNGKFTYANPAALRVVGYSLEELRKLSYLDIILPDYRRKVQTTYFRQFLGKLPSPYVEFPFQTNSGEVRWFGQNASPVLEGKSIVGFHVIARDITERKRAEEALREKEERLSKIFKASPMAISIARLSDGKITEVNDVWCNLMGFSREEALGYNVEELKIIDSEHRSRIREEILSKGSLNLLDSEITTKSGEKRSILTSAELITIKGDPFSINLVIDITERKHAEKRLTTQYTVARALAESATLAEAAPRLLEAICESLDWDHAEVWSILWSANSQANVLRCTGTWHPPSLSFPEFETATRQIEFPPGVGLPGRVWSSGKPAWIPDVTQDVNFPRAPIAAKEGLHTGLAFPIQLGGQVLGVMGFFSREIRPPDNDTLQMLTSVSSQISNFIGGKQGEEALRESEERYRVVAESASDAIIVLDEEGRIRFVNPASRNVFGYTADELIGEEMTRLMPERLRHRHLFSLQRYLETGERRMDWKSVEVVGRRKDGSEFPLEISFGESASGGKRFFGGILRDITERKKAENQNQDQLRRLAALHAIDAAITGSFNLQLTLKVVLEQTTAQLKVDAACVLLLNPHTQTLEYTAGHGFRTKAIEGTRLRLGESHAGRAALERHLVHVTNLKDAPDLILTNNLREDDFVNYYALPLIAKGQVKGILEVFHRAALEPDAEWLDFLNALAEQAAIAIDNATLFENLQRSNFDLTLAYNATIEGWSQAMDLRDKETEGHTQRVTALAERLARSMGISDDELIHVRRGALLHDIGKMGVPDGVLLKPGKLTDEEWVLMKKHPQLAFDMLSPIAYLKPALDIPYCHHEKWDGSGYPRGLKGEQIPLAARLFAVVDVWDALTSDRPYRKAWSKEKVREHIRTSSGTHFDPQVVKVFMTIVGDLEEK